MSRPAAPKLKAPQLVERRFNNELVEGFEQDSSRSNGTEIFARSAARVAAILLLLHGFPQTHAHLAPHRAGSSRGFLPGDARPARLWRFAKAALAPGPRELKQAEMARTWPRDDALGPYAFLLCLRP